MLDVATTSHTPLSSRFGRRRLFWSAVLTAALVAVLVLSLMPVQLAHASGGTAPNGPGATSFWTPSDNTVLGTAANTTSDVWFTGYNGILGEIYYPTDDTANTTDLQFMVGDSGHTWVDLEKTNTTSVAQLYDNHSLAWTVTNTANNGKYKIVKTFYTDPNRNSVIQQTTFTALTGTLSNYLLYVLYNPTMHNAGNNNTSSTQTYNGTTMLLTTDSTGNYASALAATTPYVSGMTSSGFVGENDGWTDLLGTSNCGSSSCPDYTMNYSYSAADSGNTAQTGELDLSDGGTINTSTATSISFDLVLSFGQTNGSTSATTSAEEALAGTLGDNFSTMLSTYVSQWHTFDNSLNTPPAVGGNSGVQQAREQEYYLAANVLKASQDKETGTFVAGLGTPWGDTNGDGDSGYHLVWERDLYEFASALIVAGDTTDAKSAVLWAFDTQQESDGHFPQNSYVNGTPYWTGIQMDEQAFPILLAWKLGITDNTNFTQHIKPAANYIISHGPSTGEERWEENSGYSPSTISAEIAGLVAAADIARINGDTSDEALWDNYADYWQGMMPNWTFTTNGSLGNGYYFERISDGKPNDGSYVNIANGEGSYPESAIVDMGFLELVRQGVMPANSPYITLSLPVIDSTIEETVNGNDYWFRYDHDGYGELPNGSNYDGTGGVGELWPILSGERGIYDIADGTSSDWALTSMMDAANASGFIPEQVWGNNPPSGNTAGTPTKSMNPLNWAMGEYITLLFSDSTNTIADEASVVANRYVTSAYQPHTGYTIDYNSAQAYPGKALTIYYHGSLDSQSKVFLHWGENNWQNIPPDQAMVKRPDGFWQTTISVPNDATQINMAFNNGNGTWDNNNGSNYNISISGGTCATGSAVAATACPVHGQQTTITYYGTLASSATSITMHWGYNNWNGVTNTSMVRQPNGSWQAVVTMPSNATQLNMAFFNQSNTWDNNNGNNYNLTVS